MAETVHTVLTADGSDMQREFAKARETIDNYAKRIATVGSALAGSAVLTAVVGKFNAIRDSIDQLGDQAARLELPIAEMMRLNAAAEMSGSSVETLAKAITKSTLNAVEATKGSEGLSKEFEALGINAKEFLTLGATEKLIAISNGFNSASDQSAALAALFKVLGKSAGELVPLLRGGQKGLEEISRHLHVLGDEDVANIAALNDSFDLLAKNIDTGLKKAFISLRPAVEGTVKVLGEAVEGLGAFLDPAGGAGQQGGIFGGTAMLRQMDEFTARIDEIRLKLAGGETFSWSKGPLLLSRQLDQASKAMEALRGRYEQLSAEDRLYAEQLREIERIRASGKGEEAINQEINAVQDRNQEALKSIQAEKALAAEVATTTSAMEGQTAEAENLAKTLGTIQERLHGKLLNIQTPEVQKADAQSRLDALFKEQNVGSLGELRDRANSAGTDGEKIAALQALEKGVELRLQIKRATEDIKAAEEARSTAADAAAARDKAANEDSAKAKDDLRREDERRADAIKAQKQGREDFEASVTALRLQLAGHNDLAEKLRAEVELRGDAASVAERLGITEEEALKRLRERAALEKQVKGLLDGKGTGSPHRNPNRLNNPGAIQRSDPRLIDLNGGQRILLGQSAGHHITGGLRNTEQARRSAANAAGNTRTDPTAAIMRQTNEHLVEMKAGLKKLGVI